ncbi:hypothetical protein L7F22_050491 [Adiantum nelumboides]|nr:hypothetical protein [Adiantum nelumboides]
MPETLPSCFGEYGQHTHYVATGHTPKVAHSSVTCLYQPKSAVFCKPVSITWCKSLLGQGFSVSVDDPHVQYVCKIDMKPWRFWKKQGSKCVHVDGKTFEVFWDLSDAKYTYGPEPCQRFFMALLCNREIVLLLGDMHREAYKKTKLGSAVMVLATLLSRKEHLFGKKVYHTRAQFEESGSMHEISIECHVGVDAKDPWLCVRVDKQAMVHIDQLMWKFRGNQMIRVDGLQIEVLWDAHNWLFNPSTACAVFMFHTWGSKQKPWLGDMPGTHSSSIMEWPATHSFNDRDIKQLFKDNSFGSILEWPNTHSFKGLKESCEPSPGFSLLLYAWKSE